MPTNDESGYDLPLDVAAVVYQNKVLRGPSFPLGGLTAEQEQKLDALAADVAAVRDSVNQMSALLWQLVLKEQGVNIAFKPLNPTELRGIIYATGLEITEDDSAWTQKT